MKVGDYFFPELLVNYVGSEVFTAVVMKNIIFWDMMDYTASYPRR
jgi:hypothetical protein